MPRAPPRCGRGPGVAAIAAAGRCGAAHLPTLLLPLLLLAATLALLAAPAAASRVVNVGCYKDAPLTGGNHTLWNYLATSRNAMTPDYCKALAIQAGLAMWGVEGERGMALLCVQCCLRVLCNTRTGSSLRVLCDTQSLSPLAGLQLV